MDSSLFPVFLEQISAFSPEDLYSNLLGARIAINVILQGRVESIAAYNAAVDRELQRVLLQLGVATRTETERKFRANWTVTGGTVNVGFQINFWC